MIARAEARETACSRLRPPKITMTRINAFNPSFSFGPPILAEGKCGLPDLGPGVLLLCPRRCELQGAWLLPERHDDEVYVLVQVYTELFGATDYVFPTHVGGE